MSLILLEYINMKLIEKAYLTISQADAILIGASNGISIAEGYHIFANNKMFKEQFGDFEQKYGIKSVIEGCFFQYPNNELQQEFMNRLIKYWIKDYQPSKVMKDLFYLVNDKDYFIITSNADRHFELSNFDPNKIYEIEGNFETGISLKQEYNPALEQFLKKYNKRKYVILELGIGINNRLIKQPLMHLAKKEPNVTYITLNLEHELYIPQEIINKSIGLAGDIAKTLNELCCLKH